MRYRLPLVSVLAIFLMPVSGLAQQSPVRDPQALAILTQAINAAGGASAIGAIQDFTATGAVTYNWAGQAVQGSVTIYGKALNEFRMDSSVSSGTQSFVVNGTAGTFLDLKGQRISLPFYNLLTAGSLTFPAARIDAVLNDPSTSVNYMGSVTWNGMQAYQVHVLPPIDPALITPGMPSDLGSYDLYFDPVSYQLLELSETVRDDNDINQTYLHEITFSTYTTANGVSFPFSISEKIASQQTWSITLSSVVSNTGLSDSLFAL